MTDDNLPTMEEEPQRTGAVPLRHFIREENTRQLEMFRDLIKREVAEGIRELKREISELKKLVG